MLVPEDLLRTRVLDTVPIVRTTTAFVHDRVRDSAPRRVRRPAGRFARRRSSEDPERRCVAWQCTPSTRCATTSVMSVGKSEGSRVAQATGSILRRSGRGGGCRSHKAVSAPLATPSTISSGLAPAWPATSNRSCRRKHRAPTLRRAHSLTAVEASLCQTAPFPDISSQVFRDIRLGIRDICPWRPGQPARHAPAEVGRRPVVTLRHPS